MSGRHRSESLPEELDFDDDRTDARRAGDLRPHDEVQDEFPPSREREAGLAWRGSEEGVTADDLSPETLLDDRLSRSPSDIDNREALDTVLREVGPGEIGAGLGIADYEADALPDDDVSREESDEDSPKP